MQISWPLRGALLKARLEHPEPQSDAGDAVFSGACGETGACRIPHRIYEVLSSRCNIHASANCLYGSKKAKRGARSVLCSSRFPCSYFRRSVRAQTYRPVKPPDTARIGPLRDPGAKPCRTVAEREPVLTSLIDSKPTWPCHVAIIAAHLISIF